MAHIFANGIQETATAPGTGAVTVTGAVAGYRTFGSKCAVGDTVHYRIEAVNGLGIPTGDWEVGRGTYSATNTLTRTLVLESSNANAAVNFTGACRVQLTVLAPNTSSAVLKDWQSLLLSQITYGMGTEGGSGGAGGVTRILSPEGGSYSGNVGNETGAIKIRLPQSWTSTMIRFTVKLYIYDGASGLSTSRTIEIGGYNTPSAWTNTYAAQNAGVGGAPDYNVRFGHDGTYACVWIGETTTVWSYPQIAITDVEVGYSNHQAASWINGWNLSIVTSFGTVNHTVALLIQNRQQASPMANGDSTASFEIRNNGGTGDSNLAMIRFWALGSYGIKMGLRADGYFGIGGWSSATWRWYISPAGDMVAAGNVTAYSDERLKANWKDMPKNYVVRLSKVRVGVYDRTDTKKRQVGVSAQSLRKLLPWAVTKGQDGDTLTVSYGNAALASTVELAKDNVDLRKQLKEETKARKALERRLDRLEKALLGKGKK